VKLDFLYIGPQHELLGLLFRANMGREWGRTIENAGTKTFFSSDVSASKVESPHRPSFFFSDKTSTLNSRRAGSPEVFLLLLVLSFCYFV
jgi:hypothetical protein